MKHKMYKAPLPTLYLGLILSGFFLSTGLMAHGRLEGKGKMITETRVLEPFTEVSFGGSGEVVLEMGDKPQIVIETYENLMPILMTEVHNNRLKVKFNERRTRDADVYLHITAPAFTKIDFSGAVEFSSEGKLISDRLSIDLSGATEGFLEIETQNLKSEMSGAGDLELSGIALSQEISLSGACDIDAEDLVTEDTAIRISGAGDVRVHAEKTLNIRVSGAGSVGFKGNPEITKKVSGFGSVERL